LTTGAAGWLADKVGPRIPSTAGLIVFALGMFTLAFVAPSGGKPFIIGGLMIVGLGVGLFTTPNNAVILSAAPGEHRGVASGLLAAARNVGMVCGVALAGAFLAGVHEPTELTHSFQHGVEIAGAMALAAAVLSAFRPVKSAAAR
ncbi:MAG: MFS transporter, partial [Myxococcaceae bacterium]